MSTRHRASLQRSVTLALAVLDQAAYRSRTVKIDTLEVRLALTVLWCILRDRRGLHAYWDKACTVSGGLTDSCRDGYYRIAAALRAEGWDAPVG